VESAKRAVDRKCMRRDREIFTHRALAQQTARGPKRKLLKQTETDREPD